MPYAQDLLSIRDLLRVREEAGQHRYVRPYTRAGGRFADRARLHRAQRPPRLGALLLRRGRLGWRGATAYVRALPADEDLLPVSAAAPRCQCVRVCMPGVTPSDRRNQTHPSPLLYPAKAAREKPGRGYRRNAMPFADDR